MAEFLSAFSPMRPVDALQGRAPITANLSATDRPGGHRLHLLSYNVQTGIPAQHYRNYLTNSWKHFLPHTSRWTNLDRVAHILTQFDLVGLQEIDAGSLRTGFVNQAEYLARRADFPFWQYQTNRKLGNLARHSNGFLSRYRPMETRQYKLPGLPGRGALMVRFGQYTDSLAVFVVHLALGKRARLRQVAFLSGLINQYPYSVVMGDFNCDPGSLEMKTLLKATNLMLPEDRAVTFPSWRPRRHLDHILVSPGLKVEKTYSPRLQYSDHLPVAMEVILPESLRF